MKIPDGDNFIVIRGSDGEELLDLWHDTVLLQLWDLIWRDEYFRESMLNSENGKGS